MEALADAVGLWVPDLGPTVVDILDRQVQLVLVMLTLAAIFRTAIREHAQQRTFCSSKNGSTRSLSISAATRAFLRSYSFAKATLV
jgi:hypothetical protein